ncbi:MAG: hypothetical protein ACRDE2_01085 [Chitinophagaceae bacterium]
MLDELLNLVKGEAQSAVVNNSDVPNENNEGIMQEAANSIKVGLQNELAGGGFQNVLKTLGGQSGTGQGNPIVNNITGNFANNIMQKFGLSSGTAQSVASSLIPSVMGKLVNKTNDPNDSSFSLDNIFHSLTGGQTSGMNLGGMLKSVTGGSLDQNQDGKVDLSDVTSMISKAAQGQQGSSGGGILGAVKGLFGGK